MDTISSDTNCSNNGLKRSITVKNINKGIATYRIFLTNSNSETADSKPLLIKYFSIENGAGYGGYINTITIKATIWNVENAFTDIFAYSRFWVMVSIVEMLLK
jgi:hypothetical protein